MSKFPLRLYISGKSAASQRAAANLLQIQQLIGLDWRIEVVDVVSNPARAEQAGVLATPMLAYEHPERPRRVIGDLSDAQRVLDFLGLGVKEK